MENLEIEKMIETLSYCNKEEDFSKMDKFTILYRYKQLIQHRQTYYDNANRY